MSKLTRDPRAGKTLPDESANLAGLEAAMERGRHFFVRHPWLTEFCHEPTPGEFYFFKTPPEVEARGLVIVRQIAPGIRARHFLPPPPLSGSNDKGRSQ